MLINVHVSFFDLLLTASSLWVESEETPSLVFAAHGCTKAKEKSFVSFPSRFITSAAYLTACDAYQKYLILSCLSCLLVGLQRGAVNSGPSAFVLLLTFPSLRRCIVSKPSLGPGVAPQRLKRTSLHFMSMDPLLAAYLMGFEEYQ